MSLKGATTKATMLSAVKVKGESSVAEANAQAVLDAKAKVDSALTEATAALTALQEAKTEADALPADTPNLEELKKELAKAITEATAHRDAIQALKDAKGNDSLAKLVEKVTGTGDKKMTLADIAAAVAVEVEKAMVFVSGFTTTYPLITGGKPLTATTAWSFVGLFRNALGTDELTEDFTERAVSDLPGVSLRSNDYATYGYWLGIPKEGDTIQQLHVFGVPKDQRIAPDAAFVSDDKLGNTATYSGKALGFSVLAAPDGRNRKAIKSGEFTADVKLTASFGATPTVEGTVTNFEGNAVGDEWSIGLKTAPLLKSASLGLNDSNWGLARGSGGKQNGAWHARAAREPATQRPNSISGTFQTFFSDGRAMGGYATVKDE